MDRQERQFHCSIQKTLNKAVWRKWLRMERNHWGINDRNGLKCQEIQNNMEGELQQLLHTLNANGSKENNLLEGISE